MSRYMPLSFALASLIALASSSNASAHCFVGARFFPATLAIDDPCVADEMSMPTVSWSKTADMPPGVEWDISGELSKRITENFGVSIGENWTQIRQPDGSVTAGFQNLETTFQYQLVKDSSREFALLAGVIVDWGNTGATNSGLGTAYSLVTPTLYVGKGFGELPDALSWARPFAVTGQVGYQIPTSSFDFTQSAFIPQQAVYGASLQYSLPYLKSEVVDLQLPDFFNHLIPIVEASFSTPVANNIRQSLHHDRNDQSRCDLGRRIFPGRPRGRDTHQPRKRQRGRGPGAVASISRRHVPDDGRPTAIWRHLGGSPQSNLLRGSIMRILTFAISTLLTVMLGTGAEAHAFLDHAEPRVGSTVSTAPRELSLSFTQKLEPAFSSVEVTDANGTRVDLGKPSISSSVMRIGLKQLSPGTYRVRWHVLSVDTHTTEGSFTFQVGR